RYADDIAGDERAIENDVDRQIREAARLQYGDDDLEDARTDARIRSAIGAPDESELDRSIDADNAELRRDFTDAGARVLEQQAESAELYQTPPARDRSRGRNRSPET